ncbi:Rrf2 family transcriptional regulator [Mesorhizobium sp. ZMM04-5]|uniref:Rrf2 family transcriptional regulator n=1 Tax=Mesorhizobium marinum TaxID=3228790 RepID=A0ABV3R3I2_9HYPH
MRLTLQTDYALRVLIYLALHKGRPCRITDVATAYDISRNHLLKVGLKLGRLGYLDTTRGRAGGIALARRPEDINLGEVVRQMEDDFALTTCMRTDGGACVISPACALKRVVGKALDAFLAVFDGFTLADITRNRSELSALLDLPEISGKSTLRRALQERDQ